jgi:hypothetical protein
MNQAQLRELESRIDEVLYYIWDPIGVSDVPAARGEYSAYTASILQFVLKGELSEIATQLRRVQTEAMGLPVHNGRNLEVAQLLLDFKHAVKEGVR